MRPYPKFLSASLLVFCFAVFAAAQEPKLNPSRVSGQLGDMDVWIATFRDSEDNLMALMSRTPRK